MQGLQVKGGHKIIPYKLVHHPAAATMT